MDGMTTNTIDTEIAALLAENDRRNEVMFAKFDPVTGEGSIGKRVRVSIADFAIPVQWLPVEMMNIPLVKKLVKAGSIDKFLSSVMHVEPNDDASLRCRARSYACATSTTFLLDGYARLYPQQGCRKGRAFPSVVSAAHPRVAL